MSLQVSDPYAPTFSPVPGKPTVLVTGMYGIGDNIHQRAILRELMKTRDVYLETYYGAIVHDLVAQGLHIVSKVLPRPRIAESTARTKAARLPTRFDDRRRLTYHPGDVRRCGSIVKAQFASVGLTAPEAPDFSLPVPDAWRAKARRLIASWPTNGRPILIYRPIVLNGVWNCPARAPNPATYAALFAPLRDRFFVVSVADLRQREQIVGVEQDADVKLHRGEVDFETLAALFHEAALVYCCPGFAPVLAQAVGARTIIVYGGHETSATSNGVGDHLAPTLHVDLDKPCACHNPSHNCDKTISLAPARARIEAFVKDVKTRSRGLIFATTYCDTPNRLKLLDHWLALTTRLNPGYDVLIVDTPTGDFDPSNSFVASIALKYGAATVHIPGDRSPLSLHTFADNIGHLGGGVKSGGAPKSHGRDGWGRAFTYGLEAAIRGKYEFAVHIEGDSLFRLPVGPILSQMAAEKIDVASIPVRGMRHDVGGWVETGLMFFRTEFLTRSHFLGKYDWPNRKRLPAPEVIIHKQLGPALKMMPWIGLRNDRDEVTVDNVATYGLDWLTHCRDAIDVYDRFVAIADRPIEVKVNLGCGSNRLSGWRNFDKEVDISKRLPFESASVDYLFVEHCVEHIDFYKAIEFFKEVLRVLKPGGTFRVTVPSIEQIVERATPDYVKFTTKWQPDESVRGALHAILYCHGHRAAWTAALMNATLKYAGFDAIRERRPGVSDHTALSGVEGHHKVIGEKFNSIESMSFEADAPGC